MPAKFYQGITDFIFVEDAPVRSDVIFIPGGNYPEAAMHAARLYHEGWAPLLLPSGKYAKLTGHFVPPEGVREYETEWEYLRDILLSCDVPESAILREDQATFTWENAIQSRKVLENAGVTVRRAIISCQAFHARRCLMYYQEQFPDTEFVVCPVVTKGISKDNWFLDQAKTDVVLGELERCGIQFHCVLPVTDKA